MTTMIMYDDDSKDEDACSWRFVCDLCRKAFWRWAHVEVVRVSPLMMAKGSSRYKDQEWEPRLAEPLNLSITGWNRFLNYVADHCFRPIQEITLTPADCRLETRMNLS
eukprot:532185-Amphidinium_carterae.1